MKNLMKDSWVVSLSLVLSAFVGLSQANAHDQTWSSPPVIVPPPASLLTPATPSDEWVRTNPGVGEALYNAASATQFVNCRMHPSGSFAGYLHEGPENAGGDVGLAFLVSGVVRRANGQQPLYRSFLTGGNNGFLIEVTTDATEQKIISVSQSTVQVQKVNFGTSFAAPDFRYVQSSQVTATCRAR